MQSVTKDEMIVNRIEEIFFLRIFNESTRGIQMNYLAR